MLTRLLLVILFIIPAFCQAQSLVLKKEDKVKTFGPETYYGFNFDVKKDCGKCNNIYGTIHRILPDSIQISMYAGNLDDIDPDFFFLLKGSSINCFLS